MLTDLVRENKNKIKKLIKMIDDPKVETPEETTPVEETETPTA